MTTNPPNSPNTIAEMRSLLTKLSIQLDGELRFDAIFRKLYSTDASVYQELPAAVAFPKSNSDVQKLIQFANKHRIGLIPRTAGTSLAGQVVGKGIVVDVGRELNQILEINANEKWVRVQPGVIRDELNLELAKHDLMFGPETSSSNRAMIGGMVGNNSCGSNSIVYGTTRDCTLELKGFLSDGSEVTFAALSDEKFEMKCRLNSREGEIYSGIARLLASQETREEIDRRFPKPEIKRRNTGYAVDKLMDCSVFGESELCFDFCKLLAGSEGTLFFVTEIKLKLESPPPPHRGLLAAHFHSVKNALLANVIAAGHSLYSAELIDRKILEGASRNPLQRENLSVIQGDPDAILMMELRGETVEQVARQASELQREISLQGLGFSFPLLTDSDVEKIWSLRKAGLGVAANVVGDIKPVALIEDAAVTVEDLPSYVADVDQLLQEKYQTECVFYGHAGSGELHLRPVLNLKSPEGRAKFRNIAADVASCVKRYGGSLSGEHGDGRLRGEFLESMVGEHNYELLRSVKRLFDPENIFNPGKIIDTPAMDQDLRFTLAHADRDVETIFDFEATQGLQRATEMCSGSGDCRKTSLSGGTMCPSYMVTRDEVDSTRARANMLRHVLNEAEGSGHPLANQQLKTVMDRCLSCKGCKSECPSNVDVAKLKAEFLQAYQDVHGVPRRAKLFASIQRLNWWGERFPRLVNKVGGLLKGVSGISRHRHLPQFAKQSLPRWFTAHQVHANAGRLGTVHFFCDEFTSYTDPDIGQAAIELLERLGWNVRIIQGLESGRAAISQGLLRKARDIAGSNVDQLESFVSEETPMISVEPSSILTFRDEYPELLRGSSKEDALGLASNCLTFEEFLDRAVQNGQVNRSQFHDRPQIIRLHGHCHQKALSGLASVVRVLQIPSGYRVRLIPSGCCGMAGSFGFEKEHYELSMQIGELVLLPVVRNEPADHLICATGSSCRHQILEGTSRRSWHPAEILREAYREVN